MRELRKNLLIGLTGPILTLLLYIVSENGFKGVGQLFYFTILISVGIIITVGITLILHKYLKRIFTIVLISSIIAELIFVLLTYLSAYTIVGESNRAEYVMWLPVMLMFMIPYTLPTAITVSFGSAKIIEDRKSANQ